MVRRRESVLLEFEQILNFLAATDHLPDGTIDTTFRSFMEEAVESGVPRSELQKYASQGWRHGEARDRQVIKFIETINPTKQPKVL